MCLATTALALIATTSPALAEEVNLYSYRQPELLAPLTEAFTEATGIDVNVAFLDKGMVERLLAEAQQLAVQRAQVADHVLQLLTTVAVRPQLVADVLLQVPLLPAAAIPPAINSPTHRPLKAAATANLTSAAGATTT